MLKALLYGSRLAGRPHRRMMGRQAVLAFTLCATPISSATAQDIQVTKVTTALFEVLQIKNVGGQDIEVSDLTINGRDDCSWFKGPIGLGFSAGETPCSADIESLPPLGPTLNMGELA
jgi:hypothetical protein